MNFRNVPFYLVIILGSLLFAFLPMPSFKGGSGDRIFDINASQYQFTPSTIRVQPGEKVTINLTSTDVAHGIYLDGYNLQIYADPGQTNSLTFIADQEGAFRFRCSVSCGSLHPFMIGKMQVGTNLLFIRGIGLSVFVAFAQLIRSKS